MAKPAQDCLHIQAAYRKIPCLIEGNGADGVDTLTLFNIMAYPFGWGYIQLKTKPRVTYSHMNSLARSHSLSHTHAHARTQTRTSSPETAVVLNYHIRN